MVRVPFEVLSTLRDDLDLLLVKGEILFQDWEDAIRSVLGQTGWTDEEFAAEVDRRW